MMNTTFVENATASYLSGIEGNTYQKTAIIINCALNVVLMLFAIIGNLLVIAAILKTPSLRSSSTTLLCGLAASDLLVGFVVQPLFITQKLTGDLSQVYIYDLMAHGSCGVSLCTMTAISLDRFVALHYHLRYTTLVTSSRVFYALITMWLIIFLSFGILFWNKLIYHAIESIFVILCLLIAAFSYIGVFRIVRRHQLQIHAQHQVVRSSNTNNNVNMTQLKRSSMNTFVFYMVLILCYFPVFILLIIYGVYGKTWPQTFDFFFTLVFMNSSINLVLYCWRLRDLRKAVIKTAKQISCKMEDMQDA